MRDASERVRIVSCVGKGRGRGEARCYYIGPRWERHSDTPLDAIDIGLCGTAPNNSNRVTSLAVSLYGQCTPIVILGPIHDNQNVIGEKERWGER